MRNSQLFSYIFSKNNVVEDYKDFYSVICKKNYYFRATLVNPDGIAIDLFKSAIKELYLNDNIFNPFFTGKLVIRNNEDVLERYVSDPKSTEFNSSYIPTRGYRTRGDGRDLFLLTIIPIINKNKTPFTYNPATDSYTENFNTEFALQYKFVLANEEDLSDQEGKLKKYDIKDFDLQLLSEKNIFFSSSRLINQENAYKLSNDERSVETGKMLKRILTDGLNSNSLFYIDPITKQTPYFEDGSSVFFYTSPAESTALDDLNYIYDYHVSSTDYKDFSYLKKDSYTGEYTLMSSAYMFSQAYDSTKDAGGKFFTENFTVSNAQDNNSLLSNSMKKPKFALELGEIGDIKEVKFFNPSGSSYQNKVKSVIVHSTNFRTKQFIMNCKDGNIENVKKDFTEYYVKPMKGSNASPAPSLILNNTQKTNQNYENEFLLYTNHSDDVQLSVGRNKILKNAVMQNLGVEIIVEGSFHRKSGRFISIDRKGPYIENDFDNKFLGIYLVINVEHMITGDEQYLNKIIAVKTYQFKDLKYNENTI